ncbi:hypothetical protein [Pseudonocardia sp. KRD291]|uniref:hypothetical protein n=1 Tax=Pseudonocardia sp. KRD291 TaxID=2792007 RepID=UPI001C4A563E|nr:hypothetical protein [Pseudonocardia sp. KRD291]MBW0104303.1 hypothetical protein [Pseudonocardia sp. KRD291]
MSQRERRRIEQLHAEGRPVRAAAVRVRAEVDGNLAALSLPHVAGGCGELLDVLADGLEGPSRSRCGCTRCECCGS